MPILRYFINYHYIISEQMKDISHYLFSIDENHVYLLHFLSMLIVLIFDYNLILTVLSLIITLLSLLSTLIHKIS